MYAPILGDKYSKPCELLKTLIKEDMYKLYGIITNDHRFLDENNLITLCEECHFYKVHDYKKHKTISSQDSQE